MGRANSMTIEVRHRFPNSAEEVFEAFLDPDLAGQFMFATDSGQMIKSEIDAKVGGQFVFIDRRPNGDAEHYGTYLELSRPHRIVFEFAVAKDSPKKDPVTIKITPQKVGCEVSLSHEFDAEYADYKDRIELGWTGILEKMSDIL